VKDEHLWLGDGTIDWSAAAKALNELATPPAAVLEIGSKLDHSQTDIPNRIRESFDRLG
jgi:hypothetical protein